MRHLTTCLAAALLASATLANAQAPAVVPPTPARPPAPERVPAELASFFTGDWSGRGQFASGKPIEAEVSFRPELDGQWLQYRHTDRAPNSWKALGMWGIETASRKLVMTLSDNGGGARIFISDGWNGSALTFQRTISAEPLREERFVFTRLSADSYQMRYEVHASPKDWRMIDQLVFERVAPNTVSAPMGPGSGGK